MEGKARSRKHEISPASSEYVSKRRHLDERSDLLKLLPTKPQQDSAFFHLACEIRDKIYEEALGTTLMVFRYQNMSIVAATESRHITSRFPPPFMRGLPRWLQTCTQLCFEVSEVIKRTRIFGINEYSSRQARLRNGSYMNPHLPNKLIFNHYNIFRDITIWPRIHFVGEGSNAGVVRSDIDSTSNFLYALDCARTQDLSLQARWEAYWHSPELWPVRVWGVRIPVELGMFESEWTSIWHGRFRKVQITVILYSPQSLAGEEDESMRLLDAAEACAIRLVGPGGKVCWTEVPKVNKEDYREWYMSVTVERKV